MSDEAGLWTKVAGRLIAAVLVFTFKAAGCLAVFYVALLMVKRVLL